MNTPDDESSGQTESETLPGSTSNQNGEEAEPGHGGGGAPDGQFEDRGENPGGESGESGEGSQSTGNPDSAG